MKHGEAALQQKAEVIGIDETTLKEVLALYFETLPQQISDMKTALETQNCTEIHVISHTVKGTSANLYYPDLADTAAQIEQLAIANELQKDLYEALFNKLSLQLAQIKSQIIL